MVTNVVKMFGLDEDFRVLLNEGTNWFITPPTKEEKERMDKERAETKAKATGEEIVDENDTFGPDDDEDEDEDDEN